MKVYQIPCLVDNYIYILRDEELKKTAVIDPSLSSPVNQFLKAKNWSLDFIFNTHHHFDHTGGNLELKKEWGCEVYGYEKDSHRVPGIDKKLKEEEEFFFGNTLFKTLFTPGHTSGHIVFWLPKEKKLFCGDTLFAMGCGRLFEGTPQEMFESLNKIKKLPKDTLVYCAHEYSQKNAQFALSLDAQNPHLKTRALSIKNLRAKQKSTIPFSLQEDLLTNPFLQVDTCEKFTKIRSLRDQF